jgi:hypothetical protein
MSKTPWKQPKRSGTIISASPNQIAYLKSLGGTPIPGMTKAEADTAIKERLALRPFSTPYKKEDNKIE